MSIWLWLLVGIDAAAAVIAPLTAYILWRIDHMQIP